MGLGSEDEKDFWDLSALAPKRREHQATPFVETVPLSAVTEPTPSPVKPEQEGEMIPPPISAPEETIPPTLRKNEETTQKNEAGGVSYHPADNPWLLSVSVARRREPYNFYGQFRRDAIRFLHREGEACPFVHFFSYIPQYSQLIEAQRRYYFWWRSGLRRGEYRMTEESYLYLYIYEIINLPDYIPPKDGVLQLASVWRAYRDAFPRMDKYMTEWLCDYCLVHELPCPAEEMRGFLGKILPHASLKEFYLGGMGDFSPAGVETALAFLSQYAWRESRYAKEYAEAFGLHIPRAVVGVLRDLFADTGILKNAARTRRSWDAFCGSLCAHHIKSHLTVEYLALSDLSPLRGQVTAAVKYAENRLRALLGIKSRLARMELDGRFAAQIDAYFDRFRDALTPACKEPPPAYEKWYEAPSRGVHLSSAVQIERHSWETTKLLIAEEPEEKIEADSTFSTKKVPHVPVETPVAETSSSVPLPHGLREQEATYLRALLAGDRAAVRTFLAEVGKMEEELADSINEKCADSFGDIVLENTDEGYAILSDYREEVSAWIENPKK